jgi:hypothetical protein
VALTYFKFYPNIRFDANKGDVREPGILVDDSIEYLPDIQQ